MIQSQETDFINCAYSITKTGTDGRVTYPNIPTGEDPTYTNPFDYTINFFAVVGGIIRATKTITVINRAPPPAYARGDITVNKENVEGTNERILTVFDRVSRSRISDSVAGKNYNILIEDDGTAIGTDIELISGQPTGLNIKVAEHTTGIGIPDVSIRLEEDSGLLHWATIQYTAASATTDVANYVVGQAITDINGDARFTIIPTSGFPDETIDEEIGEYSVILSAVLSDGTTIYTKNFNVNRNLPQPSPQQIVYNNEEVEGFNEKVLVLYDRVTKYIQ